MSRLQCPYILTRVQFSTACRLRSWVTVPLGDERCVRLSFVRVEQCQGMSIAAIGYFIIKHSLWIQTQGMFVSVMMESTRTSTLSSPMAT